MACIVSNNDAEHLSGVRA